MRRLSISAALLLCAPALWAKPADWPQYRGPRRDGISAETGLLKTWPAGGPKVLWKVPSGEGYSGITVAGGRLYTQVGRGADEFLLALDANTGRELWRLRMDASFESDMGNGPRSTPTVDGGLVYALSSRGRLFAVDSKAAKTVWKRDLAKDFGAKTPQWGISTSPLVEGGLLLVDVGGDSGKAQVAFDKRTGATKWASQTDKPGYSAPIAIDVAGVRQVVFFTGSSVAALSPADGQLLWRYPWRTDWDVNAATPIFLPPNRLFVSSGYDTGSALLELKGKSVEPVWKSKGMKNQFSSSVLVDGHIYGFDNRVLKCLVAATGEEKWKQGGLGHGSLLYADGRLIILSEDGKLVLAEATPAGYREQASVQPLSGRCWTAPTLANGRLYIRNQENLIAFDLAGAAPAAKPAAKPASSR